MIPTEPAPPKTGHVQFAFNAVATVGEGLVCGAVGRARCVGGVAEAAGGVTRSYWVSW